MDSFRDSRCAFIDMARLGKTGAGACVRAVLVCVVVYLTLSVVSGSVLGAYLGFYKAAFHHVAPVAPFTQMIVIAIGSAALFIAVRRATRRTLGRPLLSLVSVDMTFRPGRVVLGAALWLAASLLLVAVGMLVQRWLSPGQQGAIAVNFHWPTGRTQMIALILFAAIFPFQTAIEELVFRGALTQNLGQFVRSRWVLALIIALLFAAAHGKRGWPNFCYYVVLSLGGTAVSLSDERLELAMGAHFMNNLWASTLVLLFSGHASGVGVPSVVTHASWLALIPNALRYLLILALVRATNLLSWQRALPGDVEQLAARMARARR